MQEEVTQKTMAFSIKSAKLTAQVLQAAARKFLEARNKGKTKLHHGQQSLLQGQERKEIPQRRGVSSVCGKPPTSTKKMPSRSTGRK